MHNGVLRIGRNLFNQDDRFASFSAYSAWSAGTQFESVVGMGMWPAEDAEARRKRWNRVRLHGLSRIDGID
jgi:hypothetical protein